MNSYLVNRTKVDIKDENLFKFLTQVLGEQEASKIADYDLKLDTSGESSNVARIEYYPKIETLYITFWKGSVYKYHNIKKQEALDFFSSGSKGKWVWIHIIEKKVDFTKVKFGSKRSRKKSFIEKTVQYAARLAFGSRTRSSNPEIAPGKEFERAREPEYLDENVRENQRKLLYDMFKTKTNKNRSVNESRKIARSILNKLR
jgi:hypothetical protein